MSEDCDFDPAALTSGYLDDLLSEQEFNQLRSWLARDPANTREFVRTAFIHSRLYDILIQQDLGELGFGFTSDSQWIDPNHVSSLLAEELEEHERRQEKEVESATSASRPRATAQFPSTLAPRPSKSGGVSSGRFWLQVAIAATILLMLASLTRERPKAVETVPSEASATPREPERPAHRPPQAPTPIAVVKDAFRAEWARWADEPDPGENRGPLIAGRYVLASGVAELSFVSGAELVVQGPAAFELDKANRATISSGRVVATVPSEALGFLVRTQGASLVDLGTEFGVDVDDSGETTVHVLEGEIAIVQNSADGQSYEGTLREGAARTISSDGTAVSEALFDGASFIRQVPQSQYELEVLESRPIACWALSSDAADCQQLAHGQPGQGIEFADPNRDETLLPFARFAPNHGGIVINNARALDRTANLACEAWVLNSATADGAQRIFSNFNRMPRTGFAFGIGKAKSYDLAETGLRLQLTIHGKYDCLSFDEVPANQWVHVVVCVRDDGSPEMFINGEQRVARYRGNGEKEWSNDLISVLPGARPTLVGTPSRGEARLGCSPPGDDEGNLPERFIGGLAYVAIYDRPLSSEEVRRHFAAGVPWQASGTADEKSVDAASPSDAASRAFTRN